MTATPSVTSTFNFAGMSPEALGTELLTILSDAKRYDEAKALALIAAGADVNIRTDHDDTPLSFSAFNGWLPVVKALLAKNAKVDARDMIEETAIMSASSGGYADVFDALAAKGATLTFKNIFQENLVHLAADNGHKSIIERAIRLGLPLDEPNKEGKTPAALARKKGRDDIADMIDAAIEERLRPLREAEARRNYDIQHVADSFEFGLPQATTAPQAATFKKMFRR